MKKKLAFLLVLCLILHPAIPVKALNAQVSLSSVSMTSRSVSVSGTTAALAIMVRVTDSSGNLLAMQSFSVAEDGSFTAVLTGTSFASGTYIVSVADYEGGSWATTSAAIIASVPSYDPSYYSGSGSSSESSSGETAGENQNNTEDSTTPSDSAKTESGNDTQNESSEKETEAEPKEEKIDESIDIPQTGTILSFKENNAKFKVINSGDADGKVGTLQYVAPLKKAKTYAIYSRVTIDNITYKVTSIAPNAFKNDKTVKTVKLGKYITTIGANAFYGCTSLKTVTIGAGVKKIGNKAFYNAKSLNNVIINTTKLKASGLGKSVFKGAGNNKNGITFTVPSSKLKSYKKLFGKIGKVKAE